MNPHSYLIIGCGHFGGQAILKLLRKDPRSEIIAVDKSEGAIQKVSHLPVKTVLCDGTFHLNSLLSTGCKMDYIVPAVSFHLAFEFILSQLKHLGVKRRKVPLLPGLPHPIEGKTGDLYTSFANFLCPENCIEPSLYCTLTGERRRKSLYQLLKELSGPIESNVIRSQQLEPGLGGFKVKVLLDMVAKIKKRRPSDRLILVSTASRCHGVTSALSF